MDWQRFDRFVAMALEAGITTLVGNHLATYTYHLGDDRIQCGVHAFRRDGQVVRYGLLTPGTPEAEAWLAWFLPQLRHHLQEQGWLDQWWQHIRDEPGGIEAEYQSIHAAVKQYAPEFRTIDAMHGPIVPECDCWVPQLDAWGHNLDFFRERQQAGDQVWTYICCGPTGRYANRFIDQQSVLPRLVFWIDQDLYVSFKLWKKSKKLFYTKLRTQGKRNEEERPTSEPQSHVLFFPLPSMTVHLQSFLLLDEGDKRVPFPNTANPTPNEITRSLLKLCCLYFSPFSPQ